MSREQFEAWYLENWGHTEDHLETLFERSPDDHYGYYRLGVRMSHQAWQEATSAMEAKCAALAAENAALKNPDNWLAQSDYGYEAAEVSRGNGSSGDEALYAGMVAIINRITTPATDAWVNEQRAVYRAEGINFAAARLAAAFNHGFVDKPTAEVYDVVKSILEAKEELSSAPEDGLSGEYAKQALNDWAAQLRGGRV